MADIKPVYKRISGAWVKQKAFERIDGEWVLISNPMEAWDTPLLSLDGSTISTPKVDGVTKYKVYSNGSFIGYIDSNNEWHEEVSV